MLQLEKHVHAKFQLSSFLRKFQNFPILKKIQMEHRKRHLLPKFEPSSNFTKASKVTLIFLTPEFALEISKF
jgi:hypothetical protein